MQFKKPLKTLPLCLREFVLDAMDITLGLLDIELNPIIQIV